MVVFTCNHCGDSVQKPRVEKHYSFVCRKSISLTCMDCFKDFKGDEYNAHIKCITEEERYAAKGFQAKGMKKGELKQEKWTENIQNILNNNPQLPKIQRDILEKLVQHSNVPRKRNKYYNFMKNVFYGAKAHDLDAVFDLIENEHKKNVSVAITVNIPEKPIENFQNGNSNIPSNEKTKSKESNQIDRFKWKPTILHFIKKKKNIHVEKLKEKVLDAYKNYSKLDKVSKKAEKMFHEKLKKLKSININDDFVEIKC